METPYQVPPSAPAQTGPVSAPSAPSPSTPAGWDLAPGAEAAPVDHLSDYRDYFAANPGMEEALRTSMGGSRPLDDQGLHAALEETNAFFLQNVRGTEQQHFHDRGYSSDPVFARVANRMARTMTLLQQDNTRLREQLGQQAPPVLPGRAPASQGPGEPEGHISGFEQRDQIAALTARLVAGKDPYDVQQSILRKLEQLYQGGR